MKKIISKGFTLIELLIVIGILGILVVAVLLTLNPAEAQKRARDSKRMKDLATMQSAVQQFVDGGGILPILSTWTSYGANTSQSCDGAVGWLALGSGTTGTNSLCTYINNIPLDPLNTISRSVVGQAGALVCPPPAGNGGHLTVTMGYRVAMRANGLFEVDVRQESDTNCSNVVSDGGDSTQWAEAGSDLAVVGN